MPVLKITWHTAHDDRVCKICNALENYVWTYDTSKGDILTDALFHPTYGVVWSLADGSAAHNRNYTTGARNNCRCRITFDYNLEDILAKAYYLKEMILDADKAVSDTKSGGSRKTTFEDIGVDPSKYGFE